jgi:hypothetical protein
VAGLSDRQRGTNRPLVELKTATRLCSGRHVAVCWNSDDDRDRALRVDRLRRLAQRLYQLVRPPGQLDVASGDRAGRVRPPSQRDPIPADVRPLRDLGNPVHKVDCIRESLNRNSPCRAPSTSSQLSGGSSDIRPVSLVLIARRPARHVGAGARSGSRRGRGPADRVAGLITCRVAAQLVPRGVSSQGGRKGWAAIRDSPVGRVRIIGARLRFVFCGPALALARPLTPRGRGAYGWAASLSCPYGDASRAARLAPSSLDRLDHPHTALKVSRASSRSVTGSIVAMRNFCNSASARKVASSSHWAGQSKSPTGQRGRMVSGLDEQALDSSANGSLLRIRASATVRASSGRHRGLSASELPSIRRVFGVASSFHWAPQSNGPTAQRFSSIRLPEPEAATCRGLRRTAL